MDIAKITEKIIDLFLKMIYLDYQTILKPNLHTWWIKKQKILFHSYSPSIESYVNT